MEDQNRAAPSDACDTCDSGRGWSFDDHLKGTSPERHRRPRPQPALRCVWPRRVWRKCCFGPSRLASVITAADDRFHCGAASELVIALATRQRLGRAVAYERDDT